MTDRKNSDSSLHEADMTKISDNFDTWRQEAERDLDYVKGYANEHLSVQARDQRRIIALCDRVKELEAALREGIARLEMCITMGHEYEDLKKALEGGGEG